MTEGPTTGGTFSRASSPSGTADTCPGNKRLVANLSLEKWQEERNRLFHWEGTKQETLGTMQMPIFPALPLWGPLTLRVGCSHSWPRWEFLWGFSRMSRNTGQLLSMSSGQDEITRKEVVAWNPQAKGRMLLRKSMNCLSFYLPMDHRGLGRPGGKACRCQCGGWP